MTAPSSIDPTRFLHEQLDQASPDLFRCRQRRAFCLSRNTV